ncbi:sigma-54 interaction domain-containing protein [Aliikangiella sp. IMCC44359]|uniref:sigma-54 interaction domain-containing protein n=1 Tax=Aliikangiella sp. IMCC44359 TaxID=3459125 RepID=UPI00403AFA29
MKILRETKIQLVFFSKNINSKAYYQKLIKAGIRAKQKPEISLKSNQKNHPVIWLLVFDAPQQILTTDFRKHHANNESFIILLNESSNTLSDKLNYNMLPLSCSMEKLQQTLLIQEQKILQRNLFRSNYIEDDFFFNQKLYGHSAAFLESMEVVRLVATTDVSVFIKGETGTGKELTARSIHYLSDRKTAPFIPINCGAFNDDLILSELFGYEKGAFTGATKPKKGLLEIADSGTVFLDEVDSLSLKAQVALLRFLQDDEIRAIGSHTVKKVDVRVIAASNKDIKNLIKQDKFRDDLYYRLDVLTVNLPSLTHREEDIQLLAQYFIAQLAINNSNTTKTFSEEVVTAMQDYSWPGNVRELQNFVTRAYVLTKGDVINNPSLISGTPVLNIVDSLMDNHLKDKPKSLNEAKEAVVSQFEKKYLHQALNNTKGNISQAAIIAKKERRSFCRLMKKYGLERKDYISR